MSGDKLKPVESAPDPHREFDSEWYLEKYPDIRRALSEGIVLSALDHYVRHGSREGRMASYKQSSGIKPIVHMHIARTAGTSLRGAFARAGKKVLSVLPDFDFASNAYDHAEVISGHFGFRSASTLGGDLITVLRDPIDRFLSCYHYLVQLHDTGAEVSSRTILAKRYPIDDFVYLLDSPQLIADLFNCMVWQLAYGHRPDDRQKFRTTRWPSDDELLDIAKKNLRGFSVVGFQNDFNNFVRNVEARFDLKLAAGEENASQNKMQKVDISVKTQRKICDWVYLDIEIFRWAENEFRRVDYGLPKLQTPA